LTRRLSNASSDRQMRVNHLTGDLLLDTCHPDMFALRAEATLVVKTGNDHDGVLESTFWALHGGNGRRMFRPLRRRLFVHVGCKSRIIASSA
jgi:hypothetical protein